MDWCRVSYPHFNEQTYSTIQLLFEVSVAKPVLHSFLLWCYCSSCNIQYCCGILLLIIVDLFLGFVSIQCQYYMRMNNVYLSWCLPQRKSTNVIQMMHFAGKSNDTKLVKNWQSIPFKKTFSFNRDKWLKQHVLHKCYRCSVHVWTSHYHWITLFLAIWTDYTES